MSIAFSNFAAGTTRDRAADTIARGLNVPAWPTDALGVGKQATQLNDQNNVVIAPVAITNEITAQLQNINARWQNSNEAEARVIIDAYFENIAVEASIPASPRMSLELTISAGGVGGGTGGDTYPLGAQIGNGFVDYVWNDLFLGYLPVWQGTLVVEAKEDLDGGDVGQWQLAATMATTRQLSYTQSRYLRGILTDSIQWRFYQLDCNSGILSRTPVLNANVPLQQTYIAALIRKFFKNYLAQGDIWTMP
jgi:hypothetical protein